MVGLDVPPPARTSPRSTGEIGGSALALDITADDAPARIADHLAAEHEGVDVVVHNAGVTRDKTLGNMDEERWDRCCSTSTSRRRSGSTNGSSSAS